MNRLIKGRDEDEEPESNPHVPQLDAQQLRTAASEDAQFQAFEAQLAREKEERKRSKRDKKAKKKEKEKHKKRKREDKSDKRKKKRRKKNSGSSDSSDSSDSEHVINTPHVTAVEGEEHVMMQGPALPPSFTEPAVNPESIARDDWMISAPKRAQSRVTESAPEPADTRARASDKELNPQLNPDSTLKSRDYRVGDGGRGWRERALQRQREHVTEQSGDRHDEHVTDKHESRDGDRSSTRAHQGRGWRKNDRPRDEHVTRVPEQQVTPVTTSVAPKPRVTSAEQLTEEDRNLLALDENKLAAQLVKAEMMGNQEHVTRLRDQLTRVNELKTRLRARDSAEQDEHVVLISPLDSYGRARVAPRDQSDQSRNNDQSRDSKSRGLHDEKGERQDYFTDDNISLEEMVRREKESRTNEYDQVYAANVARSSKFRTGISSVANTDSEFDEAQYQQWSRQGETSHKHRDKEHDKRDKRERDRAIKDTRAQTREQQECYHCYENKRLPPHLLMSLGEHSYLALPDRPVLRTDHCLIVPLQHQYAITMMDETTWDEMRVFMNSLSKMYAAQGKAVIFTETVLNLKKRRHTYVECFAIETSRAQQASSYFKKAINESDAEWSQHKKLIDTSDKGLRRSIPPHFDYFYVQFGLNQGLAHVIEDHSKFPWYFAREVIGGMLHLSPDLYLRPKRQLPDEEKKRAKEFLQQWLPFDWTAELDGGQL